MKKLRDRKISFRLAAPLYEELERLAVAEGRSASDYIRRILVDHAVDRLTGLKMGIAA